MGRTKKLLPIFVREQEVHLIISDVQDADLENVRALISGFRQTSIYLINAKVSEAALTELTLFGNVIVKQQTDDNIISAARFVFSFSREKTAAESLMNHAHTNGILVTFAFFPELSNFFFGKSVDKAPVHLAVTVQGESPVLENRIRQTLEDHFPGSVSKSADQLTRLESFLSKDFKKRVHQLNKQTAVLVSKKSKPWYDFSYKKTAVYLVSILGTMIAGHILFSMVPPAAVWEKFNALVDTLDVTFLYFILGGFIAQMIDGALGMAYGVSATTFLLSFGVSPAVASMSVHASEIFTSGVSGIMHLKFGNVNSRLFKNIVVPGVIGAIIGAYILSEFESYSAYIKPIVSSYTLFLGALIIYKVVRKRQNRKKVTRVGWLATLGGFLDSIGGGGWGPVVSSTLISRGKNPRMIVGSVNLAEFFVSLASSITFFSFIGADAWQPILGLILGGICAAPIAAYMASRLNVKAMMLFVGIVVIIASLKNVLSIFF